MPTRTGTWCGATVDEASQTGYNQRRRRGATLVVLSSGCLGALSLTGGVGAVASQDFGGTRLCCHRCGEEAPKGTRKKQQAAKKYDGGPSNATQADLDRELQMVEKQKAELNNKISKGKGAKVNEETDEPKPKRKRWADPLDDDNEEEDDEGDVDLRT